VHENRTSRDLDLWCDPVHDCLYLRLLRDHCQVVPSRKLGVGAFATMRYLLVLVFVMLLLGCDQEKGGAPSKEKAKRSVGMPEDVWRMYSGAESGLPEEKRDPAKGESRDKKSSLD
jgi:hypothetical protein